MGKTDIYGQRNLVIATITPGGGSPIEYGFLTNIDGGEQGPLGLTSPIAGVFVTIGANLPKPTRMIKKDGGYTVSSFVSSGSIVSALGAKWKVQKAGRRYRHTAKNVLAGSTGPSVAVYVPVVIDSLTFKYAWRMPRAQAAKITTGDASELGIIVPTSDANARDMIFGINNVTPARASRTIGTAGENASFTVSTFYDVTKPLTKWTPISGVKLKSGKPEV